MKLLCASQDALFTPIHLNQLKFHRPQSKIFSIWRDQLKKRRFIQDSYLFLDKLSENIVELKKKIL